jgi:peptide/nickel transport system permease protein
MIWYAARRFAGFVLTVIVAAALDYLLLRLAPAEFVPPDQFFEWLGRMLTGDSGTAQIGSALAVTIPLTLIALLLAAAIGTGLGVWAARQPGSIADKALQVLIEIGVATPNFWLGMLLVLLFSSILRWLPPGGFVPWQDNPLAALSSLLLPALAVALPQAAVLARAVRLALVDAGASAYVLAAQGRGLTAKAALQRHGLRNALLAVLGAIGPQLASLIAGTLIVENVFYLSGLGRLIFDAVAARDLTTVRSGVFVLVLGLAGAMFLARLCVGWADPRLRARRDA